VFLAGSLLTRANATDGSAPITSCATTSACVEGDNGSNGPGVKGTSSKGNGAVGTTKSKGTTQGTSHAGVLGQDLQTSGGRGNVGVEGTSTNGTGVEALGGVFGVLGESSADNGDAVEGSSTGTGGIGVLGFSVGPTSIGVEGIGVIDNIFASGEGGNLFRGNNSHGVDVFVVTDTGDTTVGGGLQVQNTIASNGAIFGPQGNFGSFATVPVGVFGVGSSEGIEGTNSTTGDAIFANGLGGDLFRGNASNGRDVFIVDDAGDVFANSFTSGVMSTTLQRTNSGQTVRTYAAQTTQPTLEDIGEAQLVDGIAHVSLDAGFASSIDRGAGYIVMVTPEGMTRGTLCVTQRTPSGFTVQENMSGRSTVPFAYRLVAKPFGSTAPRLPLATNVPAHFDRTAGPKREPVGRRAAPLVHRAKETPLRP
jgi:hypothetical protein